jgi:hypothetical protein
VTATVTHYNIVNPSNLKLISTLSRTNYHTSTQVPIRTDTEPSARGDINLTSAHLNHPRELLIRLLLRPCRLRRSRSLSLLLLPGDGHEAEALGDGLQVGPVVHHGPVRLHHDLHTHTHTHRHAEIDQSRGQPTNRNTRGDGGRWRLSRAGRGAAGGKLSQSVANLLELGRDGGEGEDLEAEDVEAVLRVVLHLVLLRLAASAAAAPLPHDEPAGHHRARARGLSPSPPLRGAY